MLTGNVYQSYRKEKSCKITTPHSPNVDQANPNMTTINRTANKASVCLVNKINRHTVNAISNGRIQYPRTQTLWKKDLKK